MVRQHLCPLSIPLFAAVAASNTGNKINFPQTNEFRSLNLAPVNPPEWKFEAISNSSRPEKEGAAGRVAGRAAAAAPPRFRPSAAPATPTDFSAGRASERERPDPVASERAGRSYIRHWI